MSPTPKPPTRLTVSGGPSVQPRLSMRPEQDPEPKRFVNMAHPMRKPIRKDVGPEFWAVLSVIAAVVIFLVFNESVR
jgi:hypothetical protein